MLSSHASFPYMCFHSFVVLISLISNVLVKFITFFCFFLQIHVFFWIKLLTFYKMYKLLPLYVVSDYTNLFLLLFPYMYVSKAWKLNKIHPSLFLSLLSNQLNTAFFLPTLQTLLWHHRSGKPFSAKVFKVSDSDTPFCICMSFFRFYIFTRRLY